MTRVNSNIIFRPKNQIYRQKSAAKSDKNDMFLLKFTKWSPAKKLLKHPYPNSNCQKPVQNQNASGTENCPPQY